VTLSGANTYTGGTTVSGGTLKGTTTSLQGAIINNAITQFDQSTDGTYAGVMSGTGALVKSGTGVVTLSGANTYTGGTTINSGSTLALSGSGSIASSSLVTNNGTFNISGATAGVAVKGLAGGTSSSVVLGSNTLTIGTSDTVVGQLFQGVISGSGGVSIVGTAAQYWSSTQTYTGATTIAAGSYLYLENEGNLAASSVVTTNGLFDIGDTKNGVSITSLAGAGEVELGTQTLTITNGSSSFSGTIFGSGGLTIAGGTQTLTGANTYTGGTTVSGGTLKGTTTSLQGAITNNATTQFDQSTNGTYAGVMSGTGALVKSGTGVVTLSGANTYTGGTTVSGGTLKATTSSIGGNITNNSNF
jgi:autotransporter-associated beta strand protein